MRLLMTWLTADSTNEVEMVSPASRRSPQFGIVNGRFITIRPFTLLVLSQLAGVPYRDLATVTAGDVTLVGGT